MRKFSLCLFFILVSVCLQSQIIGNWSLTGPSKFPTNIIGQINGMGRISQIKFHPTNPNKIYAVAATGGLWYSNNSGTTWNFTGTDNLPEHDFASVCVDYTNDSILYLGGGDANYYSRSLYAVWKSVDAGATWNPSSATIGNRLVVEMLMSPFNHNEIIAATDDGIFKTYNGGATWFEKHGSGLYTDMVYKSVQNTSTIYAVNFSQILRSEDLGETWDTLTNGVTIPNNNNSEGMRIAVTPADTNRIYVGMIANRGNVLRSDDGGDSWTTVKDDYNTSIVGYAEDEDGQGNYNFCMIAHPQNPDWLFVSAHCHWRSVDGGYTWAKLTNWWTNCHTDMHDYEFNPLDANELLNANDGGVWTSSDTANHWNQKCDFLNNTEFYHAGQSNLHRNFMDGGTQDNGELYMGHGNWYTNRGGDWTTKIAFDYLSSNYCYEIAEAQRRGLTGGSADLNFPFASDNSVDMEFTPGFPNTAFISDDDVWRTDTISSNNVSWKKISNIGLTLMDIEAHPSHPQILYAVTNNNRFYRTDNALDDSPTWGNYVLLPYGTNVYSSIAPVISDTNVVYVTCNSRVYRSFNKGATWANVTFNLPNINIKKIVHDEFSMDESVYVLSGNTVYYKNVLMSNWVNYTFGLPSIAGARDLMIFSNGTANGVLRVSFYGRGIWETPLYSTPSCSPPDSLWTTNITANSAVVNWNSSGNGNYVLQYKPLNAAAWDSANVSANSFLLSNLLPYTKYVFRVKANCNGGFTSEFSLPANFTTICAPIPPQWTHNDVGSVGVAGDVCYDSPSQTYHVYGSGSDIWGDDDHFHFMYMRTRGDVTITAYCESVEDVYEWSKAGVMLRETLDDNSLHAMMAITPGNGAAFHRRKTNGGNTANYNDTAFHAPVYLRLTKSGTSFTGSVSNDNINWTDVHTSSITMSDTLYLGICHTSHINSLRSESVWKNISITPDTALINAEEKLRISDFGFRIFPNPATDELNLSMELESSTNFKISITDETGKTVFEDLKNFPAGISNRTLGIASLSNGIYFITLESGKEKAVKRFVVSR